MNKWHRPKKRYRWLINVKIGSVLLLNKNVKQNNKDPGKCTKFMKYNFQVDFKN